MRNERWVEAGKGEESRVQMLGDEEIYSDSQK
jgi:hypothetical protein